MRRAALPQRREHCRSPNRTEHLAAHRLHLMEEAGIEPAVMPCSSMSSSLCAGSGQPLTQRVVLHTDYRLLVVPAIYVVTPGAYLLVASKGCNSSQLEAHSACLLTCHPQPIVDGVRFHVVPLKSWLSPSGESEQPEQGSLHIALACF